MVQGQEYLEMPARRISRRIKKCKNKESSHGIWEAKAEFGR